MTKNSHGSECKLADPCVKCMHGAGHPPQLAVYDPGAGTYVRGTEPVCMARWASTNLEHAAGSICGHPVYKRAGDIDLCGHHYWRLMDWKRWDKPREELEEMTRALREADAGYAAAVRESAIHRERVTAESSVVYYIRRVSDGMIKIGTTTAFRKRMAAHRKDHGELQILLTHSGGPKEERAVHKKLDAYRPGRSEWFYPTRPLLSWILETRRCEPHRKTQGLDIVTQAEIRKLIQALPPDAYQWRRGRLVPKKAAAPAA